jgi:hypothetical protein
MSTEKLSNIVTCCADVKAASTQFFMLARNKKARRWARFLNDSIAANAYLFAFW